MGNTDRCQYCGDYEICCECSPNLGTATTFTQLSEALRGFSKQVKIKPETSAEDAEKALLEWLLEREFRKHGTIELGNHGSLCEGQAFLTFKEQEWRVTLDRWSEDRAWAYLMLNFGFLLAKIEASSKTYWPVFCRETGKQIGHVSKGPDGHFRSFGNCGAKLDVFRTLSEAIADVEAAER